MYPGGKSHYHDLSIQYTIISSSAYSKVGLIHYSSRDVTSPHLTSTGLGFSFVHWKKASIPARLTCCLSIWEQRLWLFLISLLTGNVMVGRVGMLHK